MTVKGRPPQTLTQGSTKFHLLSGAPLRASVFPSIKWKQQLYLSWSQGEMVVEHKHLVSD